MNFNHFNYWPGLLLLFLVFAFILFITEKRFFRFVKTYWFYKRSFLSQIASFLFLLGLGGLLISLLDIRGPEEKVKVEVPTERTIILIDTSASMLAEDVKPSRLQKAALIAKHFVRKAVGQQVSVVAFAEIQKKIVPFTNDLDLIDSRLDSLKNLRNQYGSSALTLAIQESIQYFREVEGQSRGNILVLTDGEETAEGISLKVPKDIRVALVGIGTEQGGRIPLDDGRGFRFGYKKERGKDIITKLNENFFKQVASDIPNAKYWIANSYTLPSEEILGFFRGEKGKGDTEQDMVIKPVLMEWIVVPSLLLLILSFVAKSIRIFTLGLFLIVGPGFSQEEQEPKLTPEILSQMDLLQRGELSQVEKLKLADDLHKAGAKEESLELYKENLPKGVDKNLPAEAYLNYGTALLEKGDIQNALGVYQNLSNSLDTSDSAKKIKDMMDRNIVSYFSQQEQKKKEEKEDKDKKDNKDQKDNQSGNSGKNDQQGNSGKDQQKKQDPKSGDKKDDQDKGENQDKKKEEKKDESDQKDEDKKEEDKDQDTEKKPMPPKKIPAKLKQLMSDDRQLQMKMIENGTRDLNRKKSRKSKDW